MAKIHTDAFKVFAALVQAYPTDYFVGAIEEKMGAFFNKESEAKLAQEVRNIHERFEQAAIDITQ